MNKIKVLVADDHSIVRSGLADLLSEEGPFTVVAAAKNGKEAVELARATKPDIVLMDLLMPEMDGVTATAEIKRILPETRVLILTSFGSSDGIASALRAGASGAIMKDAENDDLIEAIKRVSAGETVLSEDIRRLIRDDPPLPELSPRQHEILCSITRGLTNADIACQFNISLACVKSHMAALFTKIGAANRAEAVAIALRKHLLKI